MKKTFLVDSNYHSFTTCLIFMPALADSFSLEYEWQQVSRTLLSILAVVWMFSAHLLISKSSNHFSKPLGIVPSTLISIGITATFMFHSLLSFLARSKYLFLFVFSFSFHSVLHKDGQVHNFISSVFLVNYH